jgi:predicted nucleic acid-binding protein
MILLDSNIFIYVIQKDYQQLRAWVHQQTVAASEVSLVEVLGYHQLTVEDKYDLEELFASSKILPVSRSVIDKAVGLRQLRKMSLGDALIAATALEHGLPLATRNTDDFDWIDGLVVHNPLKQ